VTRRRSSATAARLDALWAAGFDLSRRLGRDDGGRFTRGIRVGCSRCEALVINGLPTHETGCPNIPPPEEDWEEEDV
jgi:hypothetical protein